MFSSSNCRYTVAVLGWEKIAEKPTLNSFYDNGDWLTGATWLGLHNCQLLIGHHCWLPIAALWPLPRLCWLSWSMIADCQITVDYWLLTVDCWLPPSTLPVRTFCWLLIDCWLLICWLLGLPGRLDCWRLIVTATCWLPIADCHNC